MDRVIVTGNTVQEALDKGIKDLNTDKDNIEYNVIEKGKGGFLGLFGKKEAKVELIKKETKAEKSLKLLSKLIEEMDLDLQVELIEEKTTKNNLFLNIFGEDLGIIIGYRGKNLDALQYIMNLAINKGESNYLKIILDAQGYRNRRRSSLERLALRMCKKAKKTGRKVMLEPMPPHERRIIHSTLQGVSGVKTYSEGRDPYRKVIIKVK
ncbi:RNA-binding cell elongation regulator Jag/EloR [Halonatronum saccharophilum]|uniref:RNA-binding cell elongation regulator Jag/EloR n=1 Tax=Halonatronum saccharophilum TaxID=150060 RepID=UPI0004892E0B|nr:RNA-binding cell elongation regulator Jag/EloR [Halonatronum saccharophilum]